MLSRRWAGIGSTEAAVGPRDGLRLCRRCFGAGVFAGGENATVRLLRPLRAGELQRRPRPGIPRHRHASRLRGRSADRTRSDGGADLSFTRRGIAAWDGIWLLPSGPRYDIVGGGITIIESRTRAADGGRGIVFTAGHIEFRQSLLVRAADAERLARHRDLDRSGPGRRPGRDHGGGAFSGADRNHRLGRGAGRRHPCGDGG